MNFFKLPAKLLWSCFFLFVIIVSVIVSGPIQLVFTKETNSSRKLSTFTKRDDALPESYTKSELKKLGRGNFVGKDELGFEQNKKSNVSWPRSTKNFASVKFVPLLEQSELQAGAILTGKKIINENEALDPNNPLNPLDNLPENYELIAKPAPTPGDEAMVYIQEHFKNEEGYLIEDSYIRQTGSGDRVQITLLVEENTEKIEVKLWPTGIGNFNIPTLRKFFIDSENRLDILYYIKKILDPNGYSDDNYRPRWYGFSILRKRFTADKEYPTTNSNTRTKTIKNRENFNQNSLGCQKYIICINHKILNNNRNYANLQMVVAGKSVVLQVIYGRINWSLQSFNFRHLKKIYYWRIIPRSRSYTHYYPVTTDAEITAAQNLIKKELNSNHRWTEPTGPELVTEIPEPIPENIATLQNYLETNPNFVWTWEETPDGEDYQMKINNSRNSYASFYINYDESAINIRHVLAGIDFALFDISLADFATDAGLVKLINLINKNLIYNFISLIEEIQDDGLATKKIDLSIIYNFLEPLLKTDGDSTDGKFKLDPIDLDGWANPRFEIEFIPIPVIEGESPPEIFDILKTITRQIAAIPLDVWNGYFSFTSRDTVATTKAQLMNRLMWMLSFVDLDGTTINKFIHTGTRNSRCDGVNCEIVSLIFQNQFLVSEMLSLVASVYKYLILSIGGAVSASDDPFTIAENLFISENFATIKRALQNLLADFVTVFAARNNTFKTIINSLFNPVERLLAGDFVIRASREMRSIEFDDATIDSLLYYLKLFPVYSRGFYAIFSDEFPDPQKKKLIDFLNLIVAPNGLPLIPVALREPISDFARAFFQWNDVSNNVYPKESYSAELVQQLTQIISTVGREVIDHIESQSSIEFSFSRLWVVRDELRIEPYIKLAAAEEHGIVFFKWHDVPNNLYYTTGVQRVSSTESEFEIVYHINNQDGDLIDEFLTKLSEALDTINSSASEVS